MAAGLAPAHAQALLNVYRGTALTGVTVYVKLHIGDPGAAGTSAASVVTTRNAVTFNAPGTNGVMTLSGLGTYAMTASETITHISLWDAATAGNFLRSGALTPSVPVINGSTITFTTLTLSYTPLAA